MLSKKHSSKWLDLREAPPDPAHAASFGPRDLKERGSEAWIIQTTHRAQGILVSLECDTAEWNKIIADIDGERVWEKYPARKPYGTRDAYFKAEFSGRSEPELTRAKVEQQLAKHGGDRKSEQVKDQVGNTKLIGNTHNYITARLKRDGHEELLAKVERKEISAHAAAIEMNWRKRTIAVIPTVEGFARSIRAHLTPDEQDLLKGAL